MQYYRAQRGSATPITNRILSVVFLIFLFTPPLLSITYPYKFGVDTDVIWNSTYLMLKHLVPYQSTFSIWIKINHPCKKGQVFH